MEQNTGMVAALGAVSGSVRESIRHLVVRHTNDRVHGLMFVFSTGRKLCSGRGNWGDKTLYQAELIGLEDEREWSLTKSS